MLHTFQRTIGGRALTIETGKLAQQANGAVTVSYGDTVVLVTACASPTEREGVDFLPLTVDYEERMYAAGKIPGGFLKREGRPTQQATLSARITDRCIRPLFPKGFHNEVQVIVTVLSVDQENDPDLLAIVGASAALYISDIPVSTPISAVRVGYKDGGYLVNPTYNQLSESTLDLVVASTKDAVVMIEAGANQVTEELVLGAIDFGQEINREIIALQEEMSQVCGKAKPTFKRNELPAEHAHSIGVRIADIVQEMALVVSKSEREDELGARKDELLERIGGEFSTAEVMAVFQSQLKKEIRNRILDQGIRPDGRNPREIRTITCEVGVLPRTHGSGLFTRGQTQVLSVVTLGTPGEGQRLDSLSPAETKRFMHHYNFPPFSTGEARRVGNPGRREIGHGALAERALLPVVPSESDFPYTIRLVSDVLSSNGSTSMGSVCGSILALMDAGVPIKAPVAGAAMGLIMGDDQRYVILSDIAGLEDAMGDMDFKVAGTAEGITALQMDIKVSGISREIMAQALSEARDARLFILGKMLQGIDHSREDISKYAPRLIKIHVDPDKIRFVIGPGGKTIRSIQEQTKVSIDVEDDGTVIIGSTSDEMAQKAIALIDSLTKEVEVGVIYTGKVTRITNFGAFVQIMPGKEGMVHVSELADYRVDRVEDIVQMDDEITVMVTEIDRMGRINLSRKAALQGQGEPAQTAPAPPAGGQQSNGGGWGGNRPPFQEHEAPRRRPEGRPSGGPSRGPSRPFSGNGGRSGPGPGPERRFDSRPPG
ncbi:MAG: polyribonucleotide nucleotidyltransferase, partial [Dehalococcoidia bacterium]|nr:polyribonucleotide nucleotidyltransferase [Dehalococcoidia bacterium]